MLRDALDYENQLTPSNYSGLQDETVFLSTAPLSVDVIGERPAAPLHSRETLGKVETQQEQERTI